MQGGHRHKSGHPRDTPTTHVVLILGQTEAFSLWDWLLPGGREMGHVTVLTSTSETTQAPHCLHCFVPSCPGFRRFLQLESPVGFGAFTTWCLGAL